MIVALNNKSNLTKDEFTKYQSELMHIETNHLMILCPSMVHIPLYREGKIKLGAQNVSCTTKGAHTGEIYADQLVSYGVEYCIIGHSERRQDQKESDEEIHDKVERLFEAGITPILCCGETKEEREEGREKEVIGRELDIALNGISEEDKARVIKQKNIYYFNNFIDDLNLPNKFNLDKIINEISIYKDISQLNPSELIFLRKILSNSAKRKLYHGIEFFTCSSTLNIYLSEGRIWKNIGLFFKRKNLFDLWIKYEKRIEMEKRRNAEK